MHWRLVVAGFARAVPMAIALAALTASHHGGLACAQESKARIEVGVDARVELMSLIFRLAGNREYNQPNSASPYAREITAHFGRFADHPVVEYARALRRKRGVSYDAVMSMAVHLTDTEKLGERIPFAEKPVRLDKRWKLGDARRFLTLARDFVAKSEFNAFYAEHAKFYVAAAKRLRARIEARPYLDWFDRFFGERPGARFRAIPGLLNGGGNYGIGVRFGDAREEISPVIGAYRWDDEGVPVFGDEIVPIIVHEFCHTYTNPMVDAVADALEPHGKRIFPHVAVAMRRQAYANWRTLMYESLVRACTVRYVLEADGAKAAANEARSHERRGFAWTSRLARLLGEFEADRKTYTTFEKFMPKVVAFFKRVADDIELHAAKAPKVLSMHPANGASAVDPSLATITITFDRPMRDRAWAVVGGGPHFPEMTGKPSYDAERKVLTLPVRLKPSWTYRFSLNSERYKAFQSAEGFPLVPIAVSFRTRGK